MALAEESEVLERRVIDERQQPVIPGHAPAVVEKRRRKARHASNLAGEFSGEHEREIGAERQAADHQRHAFGLCCLARLEERLSRRVVELMPLGAREHAHRLAVIHEPRATHVEARAAAQEVRDVAELGGRAGEAVQQHHAAATFAAKIDAAIDGGSRLLSLEPCPLDGHAYFCCLKGSYEASLRTLCSERA